MNSDLAIEIAPLFEIYGAACFEAQHLEKGIKLLISLSDLRMGINPPYRKMTLGDLYNLVKDKKYFTYAETSIINNSIRERNRLIHDCWKSYIQQAMTPSGRNIVKNDILKKKSKIRKASKIIDDYLKEYDISLNKLGDRKLSFGEFDNDMNIYH